MSSASPTAPLAPHAVRPTVPGLPAYRWYVSLTFAFAWVPVMFTAFTVDRGFTPTQYLDLWAAYYASMVLFELPWGWAADRLGQRPLLVAGPLLLAASFAVLGHSHGLPTCRLAMIAVGASHAMISGADSAWLYETLEAAGRPGDALHEEAVAHRWRLLGVSALDVVGGLVAFHLGTPAAFDLSVAIMLAAAACAWRLPRLPRAPRSTGPAHLALHPRAAAAPGASLRLGSLRRAGVAWALFWYAAVFVLLRIGFQLYQPTLIAAGGHDLRLHGAVLGGLNLVAGIAALTVMALHARHGERATTTGVLLLLALSFAGLSGAGPWLIAPLFCLQQVSFAFLQPLGRTALNQRIPTGERAALLSVQSLLARLVFAAVLACGHWDSALASQLPATYRGLALLAAASAVVAFLWHRRRLPLESAPGDCSSGRP